MRQDARNFTLLGYMSLCMFYLMFGHYGPGGKTSIFIFQVICMNLAGLGSAFLNTSSFVIMNYYTLRNGGSHELGATLFAIADSTFHSQRLFFHNFVRLGCDFWNYCWSNFIQCTRFLSTNIHNNCNHVCLRMRFCLQSS